MKTSTATKPVVKAHISRERRADPAHTAVRVSGNELVLLRAIAAEAKRLHVDPVETAIPCVNPFESKYVGSGTYASAMRKGLVESQDYGTVDHAVSLTPAGYAAIQASTH